VNHLDDVLLMAIAAVGGGVIAWGWRELSGDGRVFFPFALGASLFAGAVLWDAFASTKGSASWWFEESLELCGGLAVAAAFFTRWSIAAGTPATMATLKSHPAEVPPTTI
jgi:hypothetical protein